MPIMFHETLVQPSCKHKIIHYRLPCTNKTRPTFYEQHCQVSLALVMSPGMLRRDVSRRFIIIYYYS